MEKTMSCIKKQRTSERGNVLFLILIAVALFAALSYAVTQSTRSGSGTADKEQALLSSASMTQHPTAMRTSIIRMVLGGVDVSNIYFNSPANFSGLSDLGTGVFHPTGGGAVFQAAPANIMAGASQGTWFYNANWDIPLIGIDAGGGNDLIAFLPGVSPVVCRSVNTEFAINTTGCTMGDGVVPDLDISFTQANIRSNFEDGDTFPTGDQQNIESSGCTAFHGQPSGCFRDSQTNVPAGEYVFYSVLLER
jgi:hypothetical protein